MYIIVYVHVVTFAYIYIYTYHLNSKFHIKPKIFHLFVWPKSSLLKVETDCCMQIRTKEGKKKKRKWNIGATPS